MSANPEEKYEGDSPSCRPSSEEEEGIIGGGVWGVDLGVDVEEAHRAACAAGNSTYIDPETGYSVFTAPALLKPGRCCGNKCRHCPFGHYAVRTNAFMSRTNSLAEPMLLAPTKGPAPSSPALALLWDGSLPALLALQALTDQSKSATSVGSSTQNVVLTTLFDPHSGQILSPTSVPDVAAATGVATTTAVATTTDVAAKADVLPATASRAAENLCCLPVSIRAVMDQSLALKRPLLAVPVEGCEALCNGDRIEVRGGEGQEKGQGKGQEEGREKGQEEGEEKPQGVHDSGGGNAKRSGCGCQVGAGAEVGAGRGEGGAAAAARVEFEEMSAGTISVDGFTPSWASVLQSALHSSLKSQVHSVVSPLPLPLSTAASPSAAATATAAAATPATPAAATSAAAMPPVAATGSESAAAAAAAAAAFPVKPVFEHQSLIRTAPLARGSTLLQPSQFRVLMHEAGTWQHVSTEEAVSRLSSSSSPPLSRPSLAGAAPTARLPFVPTFVEIQAPAPASRFSRLR
ncbi:unnamed protein product [Closterium sp. NIES-64]|nr:unnamed protein product [Closterium sp. NIES-64]